MDDLKKYEPLFGSWYADRVLGEGSFGKVYALKKSDFGKEYYSALKVIAIPQSNAEIDSLRSEGIDDESIKTHFEQFMAEVVSEFDLMSKLGDNSNIVSYKDHMVIPHDDGFGYDIFIRMEILTSLTKLLEKNRLTKNDVIRLGIDMCKALEVCQEHKIIHRDIKPENIFISERGDYKLGDFGIARTMEKTSGEMSKKGTFTYMAPEVYKGEPYGSSVDIYSLGIVLYRLLNNNRTPFLPPPPGIPNLGDREAALARRMGGEKIPPPVGAEEGLAEIVMKAIEYNPKERFSSPRQMRDELEAVLYSETSNRALITNPENIIIDKIDKIDKTNESYKTIGKKVDYTVVNDGTITDSHVTKPVETKEKKINLQYIYIAALAVCAIGLGLLGLKVMKIFPFNFDAAAITIAAIEETTATTDSPVVIDGDTAISTDPNPVEPIPFPPTTKVALSGADSSAFILSKTGINSITAGGSDSFTVGIAPTPIGGRKTPKTYNATVTVSGAQIKDQSFNISFTVNSRYEITLMAVSNYTFPAATEGYGAQAPYSATAYNSGNQETGALTIALSGANGGSFTLSKTSINDIAANSGGREEFTVTPKTGLSAGTYNATVTVSGANITAQSFGVSFTVQAKPTDPPPPTTAKPTDPPPETYVTARQYTASGGPGKYTGDWKDGKPNGKGKMIFDDGAVYDGNWVNGALSGQGKIIYANGVKYEGTWKNDLQDGQGTATFDNGKTYTGEWKEGAFFGQGTYTIPATGEKYEGKWEGYKFISGKVTNVAYKYADPYMSGATGIYTGDWKNDKPNGTGTLIFDKKFSDMGYPVKYVGEWLDGDKHGQGTATWKDGGIMSAHSLKTKNRVMAQCTIPQGKSFIRETGRTTGMINKND